MNNPAKQQRGGGSFWVETAIGCGRVLWRVLELSGCGFRLFSKRMEKKEMDKLSEKKTFTTAQARDIGEKLGIDWKKFDVEEFRRGMDVELEHGSIDALTDVTNDDTFTTAKIALAHLNEFPDYYTRLEKMETEAKAYWDNK